MSFWSNWLAQRAEIDRLRDQVDFLSHHLEREDEQNQLLRSALEKESADHKRTLRRVADQASKQLGLPQHFVRDGEPKVEPPPPEIDESQEASEMIRWQAQVQMEADIEAGITPQPLEYYLKVIRENPTKYIIG